LGLRLGFGLCEDVFSADWTSSAVDLPIDIMRAYPKLTCHHSQHRSSRRSLSPSRSRSPPRRSSHRHRSRSHSGDRRRSTRDHRDRSRSRTPTRERSRSRERRYSSSRRDRGEFRDSRDHHHRRDGHGHHGGRGGGHGGGGRSVGGPINAPLAEAEAHARTSVKENRVYVGNLPYNCTYQDLKNALQEGGWTKPDWGLQLGGFEANLG
jgi:hypothetical protein